MNDKIKVRVLVNSPYYYHRGFFSHMQQALCALGSSYQLEIPTVIDFSHRHTYQDGDENIWDQFFGQPWSPYDKMINYDNGNIQLEYSDKFETDLWNDQRNRNGIGYPWISRDVRNRYCDLISCIFVVKDDICHDLNQFWYNKLDQHKVLAVHRRASVRHQHHEPIMPIDNLFRIITDLINRHDYTKIFLATNHVESAEAFTNRFGDMVVMQDVVRQHGVANRNVYDTGGYKTRNQLAREVLIDCMLLSMCHTMLCSLSGISRWATFLNRDLKYIYLQKEFYTKYGNSNLYPSFGGHAIFEDDTDELLS